MKLLAPSIPRDFYERAKWFKKPAARNLAAKFNVEFGLESKGSLEALKSAPPCFWGVHLPISLAPKWYHQPQYRGDIFAELQRVAKLKPDYAVMHGINLYNPPRSRDFPERYLNHTEPQEWLKLLEANIELIKQVKEILPLRIENSILIDFFLENNDYKIAPLTHLHTQMQLLDDLLYISQKTGVEIVLDLEHLLLTVDFLNRQKNYRDVPRHLIENPSEEAKKFKEIFGFWLKKECYPYPDEKIDLAKKIKEIGAKYYHVTGNDQDVIFGQKVLSHGPIEKDNKTFREHLRLILAEMPEVMLIETASSGYNPAWNYLRPNETEISFNNLCEILLEEL